MPRTRSGLRRRSSGGTIRWRIGGAAIVVTAVTIVVTYTTATSPRTAVPVATAANNGPYFGVVKPLRPLQEPAEATPTGSVDALTTTTAANLVDTTLTPRIFGYLTDERCEGRFITRSDGWEYIAGGPPFGSTEVKELYDYAAGYLQRDFTAKPPGSMQWVSAGTSEDSNLVLPGPCSAEFDITNDSPIPVSIDSVGVDVAWSTRITDRYNLLDVSSAIGTATPTGASIALHRGRPTPTPSPTPTPTPTPSPNPSPTPEPIPTPSTMPCSSEMGNPCVTPTPAAGVEGISTPNTGGCGPVAPLLLDLHSAGRSVAVNLRGKAGCSGIFLRPHASVTVLLDVNSTEPASYGVSPHLVIRAGGRLYDTTFLQLRRPLQFLSYPGSFTCWEFSGTELQAEKFPWGLCL